MSQDFVIFREQTSRELHKGLELINTVKDDYIERINNVYTDWTSNIEVVNVNSIQL